MTERVELKPCPFCGGEAGCMGDATFGYWIECGGCILDFGMHSGSYEDTTGFFSTRSEAIAAWNRRAEG